MIHALLPRIAGLCGLVAGAVTSLFASPPEGFRPVFSEEFDATHLDVEKWNTTMAFDGRQGARYHNVSYLHYVLDDDVLLEDGHLRLRADRRQVIGDDPPGEYAFSAGLVTSHDKFAFKYGYIEIRAKYPGGPGVWPAFWLIGDGQYWPPEFDIAEYYGGSGIMHHGLCYGTLKNVEWDSTGDRESTAEDGWHTYALDWRAGQATWLVDGVIKKEVKADYVPNIPMYIILSNGVGSHHGPSGVPTAESVFPNFLEVDYVRVFQALPEPLPLAAEKPVPAKPLPGLLGNALLP